MQTIWEDIIMDEFNQNQNGQENEANGTVAEYSAPAENPAPAGNPVPNPAPVPNPMQTSGFEQASNTGSANIGSGNMGGGNVGGGMNVPNYGANYQANYKTVDDNGGFLWGLLGCCIPIVGLVLFLVWKNEKPNTARAAGIGALVSVGLSVGVYILSFVLGIGAIMLGSGY